MTREFMIGSIQNYGNKCDVYDCDNCDNNQIEECYDKSIRIMSDMIVNSILE